jgi:SulP family sulfate permease
MFESYLPKSVVCVREGYGRKFLLNDLLAGLTVGVIALPLAMALAIASGVGPERGLYTAIVAGFLISALGGSRVQIGGPTGAFVVIVLAIVTRHGYDGLVIATLMAGVILIGMGLAKLGAAIKFIPYPVTTGFTSGIALLIFSSQVKDFLGLSIERVPGDFLPKWWAYVQASPSTSTASLALGGGALVTIVLLRKFAPRVPGPLVAVLLGSAIAAGFGMHVETIGSRFGGIPRTLPMPGLPDLPAFASVGAFLAKARDLIPEATTIALLAGIESLLSAVVADGMIGARHRSNCELVAQGIANIASVFFGGIPATGAIARTAANVKSGGKTPLAGMIHAVTLLLFMLLLAPYARLIPLTVLAAVLMVVAWNMAELDHFKTLFKAPRGDVLVLLTTFGLTVLADLTIAVGVGMVLAAMLFMNRMTQVTNVGNLRDEVDDAPADEFPDLHDPAGIASRDVPAGVEVFEINGPFFFGVADRLKDTLREFAKPPKVFVLRMRHVPAIDATGMHALEEFWLKCRKQGTTLLLSGVHAQPIFAMTRYGLIDRIGEDCLVANIDAALDRARELLAGTAGAKKPQMTQVTQRETASSVLRVLQQPSVTSVPSVVR